jgi:hypothetical protein
MQALCQTRKKNLGNNLRRRGGFLNVSRKAPARHEQISGVRSLNGPRGDEPKAGTSNIKRN